MSTPTPRPGVTKSDVVTPGTDEVVIPLRQNRRSHTKRTTPRREANRAPGWQRHFRHPGGDPPEPRLRCTVCRFPLDPVNAERGTHPACDPAGSVDQDNARRLLADVLGAVVIGEVS